MFDDVLPCRASIQPRCTKLIPTLHVFVHVVHVNGCSKDEPSAKLEALARSFPQSKARFTSLHGNEFVHNKWTLGESMFVIRKQSSFAVVRVHVCRHWVGPCLSV